MRYPPPIHNEFDFGKFTILDSIGKSNTFNVPVVDIPIVSTKPERVDQMSSVVQIHSVSTTINQTERGGPFTIPPSLHDHVTTTTDSEMLPSELQQLSSFFDDDDDDADDDDDDEDSGDDDDNVMLEMAQALASAASLLPERIRAMQTSYRRALKLVQFLAGANPTLRNTMLIRLEHTYRLHVSSASQSMFCLNHITENNQSLEQLMYNLKQAQDIVDERTRRGSICTSSRTKCILVLIAAAAVMVNYSPLC